MSFLKDFFEKIKDSKYGKGHKLGTAQENENLSNNALVSPRDFPTRPSTSQNMTQNEASKKAAEAALARAQAQSQKPGSVNFKVDKKNEHSSIQKENAELDKALKLKDHYFNQQKVQVDNTSIYAKNKIYYKCVGILKENEKYEKNEIENRIEMALLNRIDEGDVDEIILAIVALFLTANYKSEEKLNKCVELLNKFVENILASPGEEKYRKIRIENPIIKEKVMSCKFVDMVLTKAGFIKKSQINIDTQALEDYFIFEGDNLTKLNSLKSALSSSEPIIPELDRDIKVFRITDTAPLPEIDLSDEFYNTTIEDIKQQQKLRNDALETQGILRTKQMRERDEKLELRLYNYCLIRIKFPDNYILQATFKSNEKMRNLHELVQDCLECKKPFEFYGHSLKKSTNNDFFNITLAEAGLAPSALINFRYTNLEDQNQFSNKMYYLRKDLLEKTT